MHILMQTLMDVYSDADAEQCIVLLAFKDASNGTAFNMTSHKV